jgi:hypothetical protein
VDVLHSVMNRVSAFTAVDQRGRTIPGSGYAPNRHDILTGSQVGRAAATMTRPGSVITTMPPGTQPTTLGVAARLH